MSLYPTRLTEKLKEAWKAVLPIIGIVLLLSFTIAPVPPGILLLFLFGAVLLVAGIIFSLPVTSTAGLRLREEEER